MDRFLCSLPKQKRLRLDVDENESGNKSTEKKQDKGKKTVQMYLDYGQKSFGVSKTCSLCGMFYVIGDPTDEKRHTSYCQKIKIGPTLNSTNGHRILQSYEKDYHIISINNELKSCKDNIRSILTHVLDELGSSLNCTEKNENIYLYTKEKIVLGCLITEKVPVKSLVHLTSTVKSTDVMTKINNEINTEENSTNNIDVPCTLGIKIIWVHRDYRRQKIANKLVDIARQRFAFGKVLKRNEIAFSQPTSDGLAFALTYCKSDKVLAYSE
jgi:N-acetyltransferase